MATETCKRNFTQSYLQVNANVTSITIMSVSIQNTITHVSTRTFGLVRRPIYSFVIIFMTTRSRFCQKERVAKWRLIGSEIYGMKPVCNLRISRLHVCHPTDTAHLILKESTASTAYEKRDTSVPRKHNAEYRDRDNWGTYTKRYIALKCIYLTNN